MDAAADDDDGGERWLEEPDIGTWHHPRPLPDSKECRVHIDKSCVQSLFQIKDFCSVIYNY